MKYLALQMLSMQQYCLKTKNMLTRCFQIMSFTEFIQKGKEQNVFLKKESKEAVLLLSILDKFMSLGDGTKGKIL